MSVLVSAPAAERNQDYILNVLGDALPKTGQVLEIASGTGQHIAAFAAAYPRLFWQPSDVSMERFDAIEAWRAATAVRNLAAPILLDAGAPGWAARVGRVDVVFVVNLLHLVSEAQMSVFLDEAAQALQSGGVLGIYGPFLRDGYTTSDGDAAFHAYLRSQDKSIGYKEIEIVCAALEVLGFDVNVTDMPANNLFVLARRPKVA